MAQPPQRQDLPHFRVSSELVLIDVRVLDKQGRPVTGLTARDFGLTEEGVPQKILYFQEIRMPLAGHVPSSPGVISETRPDRPAVVPTPSAPAAEKRLLILFFNYSSAGLQESQAMEEAARRFLDTQFTTDDAAAVLVFDNGLQLLTDFTSDAAELRRIVGGLDAGADPELDVSLPDEDSEDSEEGEYLADETEFALFETNRQLGAIQSIAESFRDVPGRKALIYFSAGLTSQGVENDIEMRWTTDLCNQANISVYSVDARGLVALSPGGGAHRSGSRGTGIFTGRASLNQLAAQTTSQEGLVTLSEDTGGKALIDDNDLLKIFRQAQEDSSHYYLLGYRREKPPRDGRFRRIGLNLSRSDVRIEYRRGYYADKPYQALSRSEKEFELLRTVLQETQRRDFPLDLCAEFFPDAGDRYRVPVLLAFDRDQLSGEEGSEVQLEVLLLARDPAGKTRAALRDQVEIRRRGDAQEADTRFVYQNLFLLDPGRYTLAAYLRDNRSGRITQASAPLELLPLSEVRTSSLILASGWEKPDQPSGYRVRSGKQVTVVNNPLEVKGRLLIPRPDGIFHAGESLYLHAEVGAEQDSASAQYQLVLVSAPQEDTAGPSGEKPLFESGWKPLASENSRSWQINARLPLDALTPGGYRVMVQVRLEGLPDQLLSGQFRIGSEQGGGRQPRL